MVREARILGKKVERLKGGEVSKSSFQADGKTLKSAYQGGKKSIGASMTKGGVSHLGVSSGIFPDQSKGLLEQRTGAASENKKRRPSIDRPGRWQRLRAKRKRRRRKIFPLWEPGRAADCELY